MGVDAGESQSVIEEAEGYSAYFSPYFVETNNGRYSKHYYAGTQRMASRVEFMPLGMGDEPQQPEQAEQPDSQEQASEMASEMASGQTSGQTELTDENGNASDGNANGEKQPSKEEKEAMREYQKLQKMEVAKVEASGGSESARGTEESEAVEPDLYYYHTDHLGSTSIITDRNGDIAQYLAYIPYGETFIEERNVAPYKFNGKELDQETGYYYYGARYYDPGTALWFGVDPLASKYPMNSPYVYCHGNPISRIDYNGMDWYSVNNEDGTQSGKWFNSSEPTVSDGGQTYNHVGKTMSGFNADGSFVYGAQDGKLYNSAPLDEVTINGDKSAMMTRSIHGAQNAFLTSDYTKMAVGLMGGMMAGPAALEYGYNAAVWAAPYVKSAAIASYNAGRQAYTASSNAAKYYGSTAVLNGIKWYGKVRTRAEIGSEIINNSSRLSFYTGLIDGFIKSFDFPPDTPYVIDNPIFSFGSDAMNGFIDILKKLVK